MSTCHPIAAGVALRPMRAGDLPVVVAIEGASYERPWTQRLFHDCMRVGYSCWVLDQGRSPVGYGILSVAAGECHVLNLCVRSDLRGRGLGMRLLERLLRVGREHRADTAYLEVRPSNDAAMTLYRRAGFAPVGTRRAYYLGEHGREDAVILALPLREKAEQRSMPAGGAKPDPTRLELG